MSGVPVCQLPQKWLKTEEIYTIITVMICTHHPSITWMITSDNIRLGI